MYSSDGCQRSSEAHRADNRHLTSITLQAGNRVLVGYFIVPRCIEYIILLVHQLTMPQSPKGHQRGQEYIHFVPCQLGLRYGYFKIDMVISKYDLENLMSMSWVWSTIKVTWLIQHPTDLRHFVSPQIRLPISEIQLFQNFTIKIQGQGHEWSQRSRSYSRHNIQSIYSHFVSYQSDHPLLDTDI